MHAEAPAEPPFRHLGLLGLGLIGGSLAARCRERWPEMRITGVDRPPVLADARQRSLIDDQADRVEALAAADLVVLAVPIPAILDAIRALAGVRVTATVTDVGSTKRHIMAAARDAALATFVGGHPMAGAEQGGLAHARADLFAGRPWLLVEGAAGGAHLERLEGFVRGLGASPQTLDADTHDRVVACVSHLPQILSVALMNTAADAVGETGLKTAGPAFADLTRLAASPVEMWSSILATNADFVAEALSRLRANLPAGATNLSRGDWAADAFPRAGAARARLPVLPPRRD